MAGAPQLLGLGLRVGEGADGAGAVVHRHTRRAAVLEVVDSDGEGSAEERRVVVHLHVELQLVAALLGDGGAEHAAAVLEHEVDMLGSDFLGGHDEVTLVLAVLVVDDDDEFTLAEILDSLFYSVEFKFHKYVVLTNNRQKRRCKDTKKSWFNEAGKKHHGWKSEVNA